MALSWDECITTCQDLGSDITASSLVQFKQYMNVGYHLILAQLGRPVTERTRTMLTVASQQYYSLPPDYLFLKSVTVTVGSIAYPIQEEESQDYWNILNATTNQSSDIPRFFFLKPAFGVNTNQIGFYPIPSSANNIITLVYEATDKNLTQTAYTTGGVTIANGSTAVTGVATTFTAQMVGRFLRTTDAFGDGLAYKIASFTNATSITLENKYQGASITNKPYEIVEMFNLPEELQILPCYFALAHYYAIKKDQSEETKYWTLFWDQVKLGMRRHGTKSRGGLVRANKYMSRFAPAMPLFFPTNVT